MDVQAIEVRHIKIYRLKFEHKDFSTNAQHNNMFDFIDMDLSCGWKTVWIQNSWLIQKPADLDLHCFQKRVSNFEKKSMHHFFLFISQYL